MAASVWAGLGDPQLKTDHPWYQGELSCSTFERLQQTQAALYSKVTNRAVDSDEEKALAAWFWRNIHYAHGEEGSEDLWGKGFGAGMDVRMREYWTGLFSHGFGLCGTTHSQWIPELERLLGAGRARGAGVEGHNAMEVFLTGGAYGTGRWALLDHDISTVIFDEEGKRLLGLHEICRDPERWANRSFKPDRQRGWLVCGLHAKDGAVYSKFQTAEYAAGYAAVPPMVHLRRGESLKRWFRPGLEDGRTFVFWGRNYNAGGIPGPERSLTWVNQPEKFHRSKEGVGFVSGQARYGNAVFQYRPDFESGDYREGVVRENSSEVIFEFQSPYLIGATPATSEAWGIYQPGGKNGLRVRGEAGCSVAVSVDRGATWRPGGPLKGELDLTDLVKGHRQYWLRFETNASALKNRNVQWTTVCQANPALFPRLKEGGTEVSFEKGNRASVSAGPTLAQARAHLAEGAFDSPTVTLELATPRGENALAAYAAAHWVSGNPPDTNVIYRVEFLSERGSQVLESRHVRLGEEPSDFWSQALFGGEAQFPASDLKKIRARFTNSAGRKVARAELHLVYQTEGTDAAEVAFQWREQGKTQSATHLFSEKAATWSIPTGRGIEMDWVEIRRRGSQ